MKIYQVKLKVSAPMYKSRFITGVSNAKNPEKAKTQAVEKIKMELETRIGIELKVEATKCILIKTDFSL